MSDDRERVRDADALDAATLERYATRAGRGVTPPEAGGSSIEELFASLDDQVSTLENLPDEEPPERSFEFVGDAPAGRDSRPDDPNGAYLTRCSVTAADVSPAGEHTNLPGTPRDVLSGKRVAVKDNVAVAGVPMTCGSPLLRTYLPPADATVVERVVRAGADVVGKTSLNEFAYGGGPETHRFVLPRNPYDFERVPGGSSAGSAIAVAEGQADIALGSDTAASIRCPAAFCGVVGLKPSRGLVSQQGFVQFARTLDTVGPLARTVSDTAAALAAIAGEDPSDERTAGVEPGAYLQAVERGGEDPLADLTLGVPEEMHSVDTPVERTFETALDTLRSAGVTIRSVSIPNFDLAVPAWIAIAFTELGAYLRADAATYWEWEAGERSLSSALGAARARGEATFNDAFQEALLYAERLRHVHGGALYARAREAARYVADGFESVLSGVDALVSPTMPMLPGRWGDDEGPGLFASVRNTAPCNLAGVPALTVPAGVARAGDEDGGSELPVGIQFVGARFDEETILRAAAGWEAVAQDRWPTAPAER